MAASGRIMLTTMAMTSLTQSQASLTNECPEHEILATKENYEVRKYPAYQSAIVSSKGLGYIKARRANFFKLYRYQQGNNELHHSFPMVYPMVTEVNVKTWTAGEEKKEVIVEDQFQMRFFIPKKLHDNPPKGLSEKDAVSIDEVPELTAYVKSFPGFANKGLVFKMAKELHDALKADGVAFDHSKFYIGEYNKINQLWGRHNHIAYT